MKPMIARLLRNWPTLTPLVAIVAATAIVIGLSLLWEPIVWIFVGVFWAAVLVEGARADIKARKQ